MANEIPIFINRRKFEAPKPEMTGEEILALAGLGSDHDLFLLSGEGDRSGGTPIGLDQVITLHPGEHFRAIPGNRNFG
jgi:Multiubiquitin